MRKLFFLFGFLSLLLIACGDDDDVSQSSEIEGTWMLEDEELDLTIAFSSGLSVEVYRFLARDSANLNVAEFYTESHISAFGFSEVVNSYTYTVQDVNTTITFSNGNYTAVEEGTVLYIRSVDDEGEETIVEPDAPASDTYTGSFSIDGNVLTVDTSGVFRQDKYNFTVVSENQINLSYSLDTSYTVSNPPLNVPVVASNFYAGKLIRVE